MGTSTKDFAYQQSLKNKAVGQQKQLSKKKQDAVTEKKALIDNANMLQRYEEMLIASKDPKSSSERKRGAKLAAKAYEQHLKKVGIKNPKAHISPEAAGGVYKFNKHMSNIAQGKQFDGSERNSIWKQGGGNGNGQGGGNGQQDGGNGNGQGGDGGATGGGSEYSPFPNALGKLGETINKAASDMVDFEDPAARTHGELGDNAAELAGVNKAEAGTLRGMKRDQSRTVSDYYAAQSNLDAANQVAQLGASAGTGGAALARNVKPPDVASIGENVFNKNIDLEKDANTAENVSYQNQAESIVNYGAVPQFQKQADEIKEQNNAVAEVTNAVPQENEVDTPAPTVPDNTGGTVPGDVKTNEEGTVPSDVKTNEEGTGEGGSGATTPTEKPANAKNFQIQADPALTEQLKTNFPVLAGGPGVIDQDTAKKINDFLLSKGKTGVDSSVPRWWLGFNGEFKLAKDQGTTEVPGSDVRIKHVKGIVSDIKLKKNIQRTKQLASCISRRY